MFILELQISFSMNKEFNFGANGELYQVKEIINGDYYGSIVGEESSRYICNEKDINRIFHGYDGYYINLLIDAEKEEDIDSQKVKEHWTSMFKNYIVKEKELLDNELNNILNNGSKYINI